MTDGYFVGTTLVAGIHCLGGSQDLRHLGLGQIVVLQASELIYPIANRK